MTRTVLIPTGVSELTVTGQNLPAAPVRVICTVRASQVQESPIGASVVADTFTASGFIVHLTGAALGGEYLDYIAAFS